MIRYEKFGRAGKREALKNLKAALRRKAPCCTYISGLALAFSEFRIAAWNTGEWKGNPRFLGMYAVSLLVQLCRKGGGIG